MAFNVTNRTASQALPGQCVRVTLDGTQSNAYLAGLVTGTQCTTEAGGRIAYINSVDVYGHSFQVKPNNPTNRFDSAASPGILAVNALITIG